MTREKKRKRLNMLENLKSLHGWAVYAFTKTIEVVEHMKLEDSELVARTYQLRLEREPQIAKERE